MSKRKAPSLYRPRKSHKWYRCQKCEMTAYRRAAPRCTRCGYKMKSDARKIGQSRSNPDISDSIRAGDRVTVFVYNGMGRGGAEYKRKTGTAVMRGPAGWVLNMGGQYGTPFVATPDVIASVSRARHRKNPAGPETRRWRKWATEDIRRYARVKKDWITGSSTRNRAIEKARLSYGTYKTMRKVGANPMNAEWNVHKVAKMNVDQRLVNWARQIEQEAVDWGRSLGHGIRKTQQSFESGHPSSAWQSRLTLVRYGKGQKARVQVYVDDKPVSPPIKAWRNSAPDIYRHLRIAVDNMGVENPSARGKSILSVPFKEIKVGAAFLFAGTHYQKSSSRTARLLENKNKVFYFKPHERGTIIAKSEFMNPSRRAHGNPHEDDVRVARWAVQGGKRWVELYRNRDEFQRTMQKHGAGIYYRYQSDNGGGTLPVLPNDQAAIAWMEAPWGRGGAGPVTVLKSDFSSVKRVGNNPSKKTMAGDDFDGAVAEFVVGMGGKRERHGVQFHSLDSPAGKLRIESFRNWISMRFDDPKLANAYFGEHPSLASKYGIPNPYSGKWNCQFVRQGRGFDAETNLDEMKKRLIDLMRSGR